MRFTKALGAAAALCLLLAACTPKAMETFSAWEPEILLYPGDTWEGEIPGDGEEAAYTISVNTVPGLEARLEGGKLILSATQPGGGQVYFSLRELAELTGTDAMQTPNGGFSLRRLDGKVWIDPFVTA